MPKTKNIIIFVLIFAALVFLYLFFFKKAPEQGDLVSSAGTTNTATGTIASNETVGQDFLAMLLNVKNISLNDSIFSDPAFMSLVDSSIILVPDTNPGRPNPFAPIGQDLSASPILSTDTSTTLPTSTTPSQTAPAAH